MNDLVIRPRRPKNQSDIIHTAAINEPINGPALKLSNNQLHAARQISIEPTT